MPSQPVRVEADRSAKGRLWSRRHHRVSSRQSLILECLDATERLAGTVDRWVSASAVARRLGPTADPQAIGKELSRLERLGLVELWFRGGSSYYRTAR